MQKQTITISIPCYNDMYSIQSLFQELYSQYGKQKHIHFLLIDDGSSDNTAQVLKRIQQKYKRVELICHTQNMGFGFTIKEAVTTPKTDVILFLPGDNQFRSDAAQALIDEIIKSDADYILGIRKNRKDNIYRKFLSNGYNSLISTLSKHKVSDINSIFIVKRDALDGIQLKSKSAFIHAEIYLELYKSGKDRSTIIIPHHPRLHGKGSGGKLKTILPTVIEFFKYLY